MVKKSLDIKLANEPGVLQSLANEPGVLQSLANKLGALQLELRLTHPPDSGVDIVNNEHQNTEPRHHEHVHEKPGTNRGEDLGHTHTLDCSRPIWTQFQYLRFSIKPFLHFNNVDCVIEYCIPEFVRFLQCVCVWGCVWVCV